MPWRRTAFSKLEKSLDGDILLDTTYIKLSDVGVIPRVALISNRDRILLAFLSQNGGSRYLGAMFNSKFYAFYLYFVVAQLFSHYG